MNIADAARFIADGMTMKIELSENVDKKIDAIREEVKEMVNSSMNKIDRRWYITQVLLGIGLVGNAIAMMLYWRPCQDLNLGSRLRRPECYPSYTTRA